MAETLAQNKRARYLDANEAFHLLFDDADFARTLNDAHEGLMRRLKRRDAQGARRAVARDLRHAAKPLRMHCLPDDPHTANTA